MCLLTPNKTEYPKIQTRTTSKIGTVAITTKERKISRANWPELYTKNRDTSAPNKSTIPVLYYIL